MPPTDAVLKTVTAALPALVPIQQIRDLSVRPGVNVVDIRFSTLFPAVPIVDVARIRTDQHAVAETQSVFPVFGGLRQVHNIHFENLRPNTRYGILIRAAGAPGSGIGLASVSGGFTTGSRSGRVVFERLTIFQVSDNEMVFKCAVYNGTTEEMVGPQMRLPAGGGTLECGRTALAFPFPDVTMPSAPPSVRVYIWGYDQDDDWEINLGLNIVGENLPSTTPTPQGIRALDDEIIGDALETLKLPEFPGPAQKQPFVLSALDERFGYELVGFVESTVTTAPLSSMPLAQAPSTFHTAISRLAGQIAAVTGGNGKTQSFTMGPDGGAYRLTTNGSSTRQGSWRRIGDRLAGPLAVVADARGGVDLFAAATGGGVMHGRSTNSDPSSKTVWRRLDAPIRGEVFPVRGRGDSIELFALDSEGAIRHVTVGGRTDKKTRKWDDLGGSFTGSVFVVQAAKGFHVFVSDTVRGVFHQRWPVGDRTAQNGWTSLGRGFVGVALAHVEEDGMVTVLGFRDGTPAVYKTLDKAGRWNPDGDKWLPIASEGEKRRTTRRQRTSR
ncbi:MAG TPA: hypothetical protein VH701_24140 [Vicinamibacterales bacterium]|jgi:hypothetical protein